MSDFASRRLRVFLCHASQDKPAVRELYNRLTSEKWIEPWLDEENLLPGQDWELEIEKALDNSDAVIVSLSTRSVSKEGYVQKELRVVLDIALEKPEGTIFVLPVRLDDCERPRRLRPLHGVDYFPPERRDWAYTQILRSLEMRAKALGVDVEKGVSRLHLETDIEEDEPPSASETSEELQAKAQPSVEEVLARADAAAAEARIRADDLARKLRERRQEAAEGVDERGAEQLNVKPISARPVSLPEAQKKLSFSSGTFTITVVGLIILCVAVAYPILLNFDFFENIRKTFTLQPNSAVPPVGGGNNRIAYTARAGSEENLTIYVADINGSGSVRLTNEENNSTDPVWSSDGSRIAFASDIYGNFDIFVINSDGSGLLRLTSEQFPNNRPTWSPDSSRLAFHTFHGGQFEIYVLGIDGSEQINLTNNSGDDMYPAWSPDGTKIAFTSSRSGNHEMYVMNIDGTQVLKLTDTPGDESTPSWSPDGSRLAFSYTRSGFSQIYVMNGDGSGRKNLTRDFFQYGNPVWAPNGNLIAFDSSAGGYNEIYVMNADGSNQMPLTNNYITGRQPAWQP